MTAEDDKNAAHREAMKVLKAEREALMATKTDQAPGLLLLHTGDGKGKSTAAFGMVARALGWGQKVGIVQYIKGKWVTGERQFFKRFPDEVRYEVMGEGFTWDTQDRARDIAAAEAAWTVSLEMLADPALDLVLFDELNIALRYDYLDIDQVVAAATTPELAVEIYAASVLAIDPDDPAEQAYLAMLASRLKLEPGLRAAIERETAKVLA